MLSRPLRARSSRLLLATLVVGIAVVAPVSRAEAVLAPRTLYHETRPGAGPIEPGFPIDHVGIVVPLPPGRDDGHAHADHDDDDHHGTAGIAVRFRHDGRWGPWRPLIEDGAQAEGTWTSALVEADDAEAYQVRGVPTWARGVRAAAINTTDGDPIEVGRRPSGGADALTRCRARIDWGADESIRTSSRSYAPMRIATVHHTATRNADPDPAARVRAIYAYHVRTNGWADIGYQALIAEDGTVYEGRWSGSDSPSCRSSGGTTLPFGHRGPSSPADIVVGAHSGGANTGNFGIALLGTFTSAQPTTAARSTLVAYLDELTARHGIAPDRQVAFTTTSGTRTVWTISGHRDFTATECPGGALYARLPALRDEVASLQRGAAPTVAITTPSATGSHGVTEPTTGAGASVTFAADAVASSSPLTWRWTDGGGTVLASTASFTRTLAVGTHPITVTVTDPLGRSGEDTIVVTVAPLLAPVSAPSMVTTTVVSATVVDVGWASVPGASGFDVERSVDGAAWLKVASPAADATAWRDTAAVPASSHRYRVRSIGADGPSPWAVGPTVTTPALPVPALTASLGQANRQWRATLTWTGPTSVTVHRDDGKRERVVATVTGTTYVDVLGSKVPATLAYRVCRTDAPTVCSNTVTLRP